MPHDVKRFVNMAVILFSQDVVWKTCKYNIPCRWHILLLPILIPVYSLFLLNCCHRHTHTHTHTYGGVIDNHNYMEFYSMRVLRHGMILQFLVYTCKNTFAYIDIIMIILNIGALWWILKSMGWQKEEWVWLSGGSLIPYWSAGGGEEGFYHLYPVNCILARYAVTQMVMS